MSDLQEQPGPRRPEGPQRVRRAAQAARRVRRDQRQTVPPFGQGQLQRELALDAGLRAAALVLFVLGLLWVFAVPVESTFTPLVMMALVAGWIALGAVQGGVLRALPLLDQWTQENPATAEAQLARLLRRRPLPRWLRLMLYHRLAVLRQRQGRAEEAAWIAAAVLVSPGSDAGPMRGVRPALLLMNAQMALDRRDVYAAYAALVELHHQSLDLASALQRLLLQTRYELLVNAPVAALAGLRHKVRWAELMPAPMCGLMHAMLAEAARRGHADPQAAQWLQRRAVLLCEPRVRRALT